MLLLLFTIAGTRGFSQQRQFNGTVLSTSGLPVRLASIQVVGSNRGTSADEEGFFKIDANTGDQLEVSAVGFVPQIIKVGQNSRLVITLTSSGNDLGEVV